MEEGPPSQRRAIKRRRTTATATATATKTISDLPDDIICGILSRLPLKSIISCKPVCTAWRNLLLEPYFAQLHLPRSPLSLILYRPSDRTNPSRFSVLELDDPEGLRSRNATVKFRTEINIGGSHMEIVGSCNGSICLSDCRHKPISGDTVIVCNPTRGRRFILPKPPKTGPKSSLSKYGFGYSPSSDQYKVVRFTGSYDCFSRLDCDIYILGNDDEWRSIGDTGQPSPTYKHNFVYLNGALHWIGFEENNSRFICYVDIDREQFGNFPLPSYIGRHANTVGVLDNCLCICGNHSSASIGIWVMKDYRQIESLTLEWAIERELLRHGLAEPIKPVKTLTDGTVLIIFREKTLASYNPETRVLERISYQGVRFWAESVADVPSFLSPMDAMR